MAAKEGKMIETVRANDYKTITLTLTENCNLSCTYCYEHNKTLRSMPYDTAIKIIDKAMHENDFKFIHINFFGGEPFVEFELLKTITQYVCQSNYKKPYILFATTNGTLVHGEVQKWLSSLKGRFFCGLSLDGNKSMHDINRCNSFDSIDLDFFLKMYPQQPVKMTISQATLPFLADGVVFAHNKGFNVNCNLAFGIDWSDEKNIGILTTELNKLIDYYLVNTHIIPCTLLGDEISQIAVDGTNDRVRKWCGTGTNMATYDVDGKEYPCQFFMPLSAGDKKAIESKDIIFSQEIPVDHIDLKCKSCVALSACPTCYGSNYVSSGNLYHKDDNYCNMMKIILKARSYFKYKQWKSGMLQLDKNAEILLLDSIIKLQEAL